MSYVLMIDPSNPLPSYDTNVYSVKSKFCHGLELVDDKIYFMDEYFKIHILQRQNLGIRLEKVGEMFMKESEARTLGLQTELSTDFAHDNVIGRYWVMDHNSLRFTHSNTHRRDWK